MQGKWGRDWCPVRKESVANKLFTRRLDVEEGIFWRLAARWASFSKLLWAFSSDHFVQLGSTTKIQRHRHPKCLDGALNRLGRSFSCRFRVTNEPSPTDAGKLGTAFSARARNRADIPTTTSSTSIYIK
jgi:hypothetical protein